MIQTETTLNILTFLRRVMRAPPLLRVQLATDEAIRTGGGVLFPGSERHAGRALITLHSLTATGHTAEAALRNWCKMANSEVIRAERHYHQTRTTPQPQGAHP